MPYAALDHYRNVLPLEPEDGEQGYILRKYWTQWIGFCLGNGTLLGLTAAVIHRYVTWENATSFSSIVGFIVFAYILTHSILFWYWAIDRTFVMITPANVYHSRMEKLFRRVVETYPVKRLRFHYHYAATGTLGVGTIDIMDGEMPVISYSHTKLGLGVEKALNDLTNPST